MRQLLTHVLLCAAALHATACTVDDELSEDSQSLEEALDSDLTTEAADPTTEAADPRPQAADLVTVAAVQTTGPWRIKNYHSGKCLEVPGNSTANSVLLDQWTCLAGRKANEDWYLDWINGSSFRIRNRNSGKCMSVHGNSTAQGAHIDQFTCNGQGNELFFIADATSGFYWIGATSSARYFNISGASTANGADLIQWDPVNASNMWFSFTASP